MRKRFQVEIEIDDKDYFADGVVDFVTDYNYGADADGKRGIERTTIDNFDIDEVVDIKGSVVDITPEMYIAIREKVYELNEGDL
jgi:hypothetical protein